MLEKETALITWRKVIITLIFIPFCRELNALQDSTFQKNFRPNLLPEKSRLMEDLQKTHTVVSTQYLLYLVIFQSRRHSPIQSFFLYQMMYLELSFRSVKNEKPRSSLIPIVPQVRRGFQECINIIFVSKGCQRVEKYFLYQIMYYSEYFDIK